ncbi:hypothetical protein IF650_13055 [Cellulosimicrobium terreum]|nr:hypothetical protein [Cellulosimicrobium terreum]
MGWTSDLLIGLAEHLADVVPDLAWRPSGTYTPGEVGVVLGAMPATPDRVVVLTAYPVTGSGLSDVVQGVQVRCRGTRGSPTDGGDLDDAVYTALHGAQNLNLGGVAVAHTRRASAAQLGPDANRRFETTSNYYLTTAHPSAHVTD